MKCSLTFLKLSAGMAEEINYIFIAFYKPGGFLPGFFILNGLKYPFFCSTYNLLSGIPNYIVSIFLIDSFDK